MIIFCCKGYRSLEDKIDEVIYKKFKNDIKRKKDKIKNIQRININSNRKKRNKTHKETTKSKIKLMNNTTNEIMNKKNFIDMLTSPPDNSIKFDNDYELNNLSFILAIKYDKRVFCEYYCSLIKMKQISYKLYINYIYIFYATIIIYGIKAS